MAFLHEYTMLDELGKGGYATVYKVRHNELGYIRAIRVLNETIVDTNSTTYQKFMRECKVLLRLGNGSHPNIVHIYQPRLLENKALVEMDFVDGQDLSHYLRQEHNFVPKEEVIRMAEQIGSALAYCHEDIYRFCMDRDQDQLQDDPDDGSKVLMDEATRQRLIAKYKVIHNDIHSGNIMRRGDGNFVLLDFGLAINGDEVVRSSRHTNGAPEFKAPEKWNDESVLTEQSDIYSFGVVLYEMLAGRVPFPYDNSVSSYRAEFELGEAHQRKLPPPIYDLRKQAFEAKFPGQQYAQDYPDWLNELILKCLCKNPADRFKNGKELYAAIKHGIGGELKQTSQVVQAVPVVPEKETPVSSGPYYLKLKSDTDCHFYLDGEERMVLKAGDLQKIPLSPGEYELRFVSVENPDVVQEMAFVMPEHDKFQNVSLREASKTPSQPTRNGLPWVIVGAILALVPLVLSLIWVFSDNKKQNIENEPAPVRVAVTEEIVSDDKPEKSTPNGFVAAGEVEKKPEEGKNKATDTKPQGTGQDKVEKAKIAQGYVDLGLPSGTLWKDKSVGIEADCWGYDAALEEFGDELPTKKQLEELTTKCKWTWTGKGYSVVGPNGKSIYLHADGCCCWDTCNEEETDGFYWSCDGWGLCFASDGVDVRRLPLVGCCYSVRLVKD